MFFELPITIFLAFFPLVALFQPLRMFEKKPERIGYPNKDTRFKHYGYHVQNLINKAMEMEEGPVKEGFVQVIGSYMKLAYRTWNKEHYVSDDLIITDLDRFSDGKLKLIEDVSLDGLTQANKRRRRNAVSGRGDRDRDDKGRNGRKRRDGRGGGRDRDGGGEKRPPKDVGNFYRNKISKRTGHPNKWMSGSFL